MPFKGATAEMLAMLTQQGSEIEQANQTQVMGLMECPCSRLTGA